MAKYCGMGHCGLPLETAVQMEIRSYTAKMAKIGIAADLRFSTQTMARSTLFGMELYGLRAVLEVMEEIKRELLPTVIRVSLGPK